MSVNEMSLAINRENPLVSSQTLGALAMLCAPMLLVFLMFGNIDGSAPKTLKDQFMSLTGVLYIGGWMAGIFGLRRLRATGEGFGAKIVFVIQITLLSFAMLFSVMEAFGYTYENGGWLFAVADAGYPLSHLFMIVTGIFVRRAGVLNGLARIAPFLVGLALPVFLILSSTLGMTVGGIGFGVLTAAGLGINGYSIYKYSRIYSLIFSLQS